VLIYYFLISEETSSKRAELVAGSHIDERNNKLIHTRARKEQKGQLDTKMLEAC
jgi:hypothetical protein